jgi:hypothetical protein
MVYEHESRHHPYYDLALDTCHRLKAMEESPEIEQLILRMIFAVERAAAGVLDNEGEEQALRDAEAAVEFCDTERLSLLL